MTAHNSENSNNKHQSMNDNSATHESVLLTSHPTNNDENLDPTNMNQDNIHVIAPFFFHCFCLLVWVVRKVCVRIILHSCESAKLNTKQQKNKIRKNANTAKIF